MAVDRHVIKMILETAQLLSTAHRILDGTEYIGKSASGRNAKRWKLDSSVDDVIYQATHIHHPSSVWTRLSSGNYQWLYWHFVGLIDEYYHRYGKVHKCDAMKSVLSNLPKNIKHDAFTQPTPAMDDKYIVINNSLASYRNYYILGKTHLHKYTKRHAPDWLMENTNMAVYTFRNKKTDEVYDISMPMSEIDDFEKNNDHLERVYTKMNIVDPAGIGVSKPPADFSKHVLGRIKAANPHSEIGNGRWKLPKEI